MSSYFKNITNSVQTLTNGMKLTWDYLWDARHSRTPIGVEDPTYFDLDKGIVTLQYPYESLPVPDNGRYRLHNEIEDCIVCDKCAKICPVNCIDIEPIKATEEFGKTSDGTPKRIYAAKFDIDMAKCCFCGLCTTVCPTECLTMTNVYDFSEYDVRNHNFAFAEMTPLEILEKRALLEKSNTEKQQLAEQKNTLLGVDAVQDSHNQSPAEMVNPLDQAGSIVAPKPVFRPKAMVKPRPQNPE